MPSFLPLFHVFLIYLWGRYCYYPHLTDRETEIKKKWLAQDQILSGEAWLSMSVGFQRLGSSPLLWYYKEECLSLWEGDCLYAENSSSFIMCFRLYGYIIVLISKVGNGIWQAFEISWAHLVPSLLVHLVPHQFFKTLSLRSCCWQNMDTVHFFQSSSALLHSSLLVIFPNWAYWVKTEIHNMMDGWRGEDRCGSQDKGLLSEIPWINPLPGIFFSRKSTL